MPPATTKPGMKERSRGPAREGRAGKVNSPPTLQESNCPTQPFLLIPCSSFRSRQVFPLRPSFLASSHEPAGKRGRQTPAPEYRDPGDRALQRGARPGLPDPPVAGGRGAGPALRAEARAQRLPDGNAAGLQLPDGAARDACADAPAALPAPAGGADAVPVASEHPGDEPLGPGALHLRLRRPGGVALAGLLRGLARNGEWPLPEAK
jgi:hypothetical protein